MNKYTCSSNEHDRIRSARLTSDAACYTASARRYEDIEQACKREVVSDHQWSFKGCLPRQEWLHFPETVRCIVHIRVFHLHWISSSRQGF